MDDDQQCVALVLEGDDSAFERLIERYQRAVYNLAYRMLGERGEAEEAAQELRISESHCRRLLETGKIKGIKLGHDWVVRELKYKRKRKQKILEG